MAEQQASSREVVAVQAFLDEFSEDRIMRICDGVLGIEGVACSFPLGMIPHFTIGSWWVTTPELEEAKPVFTTRLTSLRAVEVSVDLLEREKDEPASYSYFLRPEVTDSLRRLHAGIHEKLGYPYEPYRKIDLPGSWWPHLTLFTIPKEKKSMAEEQISRLKEITTVRIARLGLVTFYPTIETVTEVRLRNAE